MVSFILKKLLPIIFNGNEVPLLFKDPSFLCSLKKFSPQVLKDILFYAKFFSLILCLHLWFIHLWFLGSIKAMTDLDSVYRMPGAGALAWPREDGTRREVGRGFRWETCIRPWVGFCVECNNNFQCKYCKVKKKSIKPSQVRALKK